MTETQVFKHAIELAAKRLSGDTENQWFLNKINNFVRTLNFKKSLANDLMIEIEKRNLTKVAELMGIEIRNDFRAKLRNNSNSISILFSSLLNSFYSLIGVFDKYGIPFVSLPEIKFVNFSKLSNTEIQYLLDYTMEGNKTSHSDQTFKNWFINKYKVDFIYNRYFLRIFYSTIIIYLFITQLDDVMNPEKMIEKVAQDMDNETYNRNLNTIKTARDKLSYYIQNRSVEGAEHAIQSLTEIILNIENQNRELLAQINKDL